MWLGAESSSTDNAKYKWQVLIVVMIGTMMAALDTSIVNVSIPSIMGDFGVGVDDIEWVVTGYMLAFATLMPLTAWFRDHIGQKKLYAAALVLFTLGSVLCGFAWNLQSLVAARVLQALGGGAVTPIGMAMISEVFEPKERGKAMGYWGMGIILGPTIGPTLGGILTKYFGWRSIFLVNLPIGIIGFFLAMAWLRDDEPHSISKRRFDLWGFVFLSVFLVAFLLGLSNGEKEGWTSNYIITCSILSIIGLVGFLLVESLIPEGIIDIRLFKIKTLAIASLVMVVRSIALFGGIFLLPLFLQQQMGFDEIQSGLILLPGAAVVAICMPFGGKLGDRIGSRVPALVGLIAVGWFMLMYRNIDVNTSLWNIIYPTLVRGFGMALLMAPIMATAMNAVPLKKAGITSSMLNILQQVAGSLGIAILTTVLSHRIRFHMAINSAAITSPTPAIVHSITSIARHAHTLGYSRAQSAVIGKALFSRQMAQAAIVSSFQDAFMVGAGIVALALIPALFLPGRGLKSNKPLDAHIAE
jgi:DHA2 family multidrug resistance protein